MPFAKSASRTSPVDEVTGNADSEWLAAALAQPGASRFVEVDGARIHYLVWGDADPDKPVLLFVHGFRAHAHWWDAIAPSFSQRYRVIAPDLSGMGDSDRRQAYPDPVYARDLIGVLEHECVRPVTAVGHSYGGSRVIQACTLRPQLFSRLVLVDTYMKFEDEPLPQDLIKTTHTVYPDMAQAIRRFRLLPEQPCSDARYHEHMGRHSLRAVPGGFGWKFDPDVPSVAQREGKSGQMLRDIAVPVDYVYGDRSAIVNAARAQRIVQALRFGRGPIEIPNAYHHVMLDQPVALVSALRALLVEGA